MIIIIFKIFYNSKAYSKVRGTSGVSSEPDLFTLNDFKRGGITVSGRRGSHAANFLRERGRRGSPVGLVEKERDCRPSGRVGRGLLKPSKVRCFRVDGNEGGISQFLQFKLVRCWGA